MGDFFINQFGLFLMYLATGIIISLLFDIFRASRRTIKTSDTVTFIEDIIFWILATLLLLYITFILNSGNIRLFNFVGLALGGILYYFTVSKYFIKIMVIALGFIKKVSIKAFTIILIPLKIFLKVNKKIFYVVCINLQKVTNIFNKIPPITKKQKKTIKNCQKT